MTKRKPLDYRKAYSSRELIQLALQRGFVLVRTTGSHHQFEYKHLRLTIPHPEKQMGKGLTRAILKLLQEAEEI